MASVSISTPTSPSSTQSLVSRVACIPGVLPGSKDIFYHVKTIWLFTRSDLKTIVGPSTLFAISNAAAISHSWQPLLRLPLVVLWIWLNLLPFSIGNQRSTSAIAEDLINKPWRPMPSGRLTQSQARAIMYVGYIAGITGCSLMGVPCQCLGLVFLGTWYNDLGGADLNCVVRNFINACGYLCFVSGALEIALTSSSSVSIFDDPRIIAWLLILGGIIQTTVHSQDLGDQEGDRMRGRKTVPLELGDLPARLAICVGVPAWTVVCSSFWQPPAAVTAAHFLLAVFVAWRTFRLRTAKDDNRTFKFWNLWIGGVYVLPLCATLAAAN